VNIEKTVRDYLEDTLSVWVGGSTPKDTGQQFIRVTQLDERNVAGARTDHFNDHMIQLDCYASGDGPGFQGEAQQLYRDTRDALAAMSDETFTGVVVTAVTFSGCPRIPDTDFEPARQRYIINAFVYAHSA